MKLITPEQGRDGEQGEEVGAGRERWGNKGESRIPFPGKYSRVCVCVCASQVNSASQGKMSTLLAGTPSMEPIKSKKNWPEGQ